ncbi:cell division protein ZapB [Treponema sp. TIM-1]|uniref:cell division protein ZapB n=1 Tax=Treponema sp. TIM-1 TaxID=2898417 RepID=UPI003980FEFB
MVTLEQVKLLETKVAKALDFVSQVTGENTLLKEKLDAYQRRIDELEVLIQRFKEDQGRIEEGIISALNRLNQFEDAVEKSFFPNLNGAGIPPEKIEADKSGDSNRDSKVPLDPPDEGYLSESPEDEPLLTAAEFDTGLFEPETEISEPPEAGETTGDASTNTAELDIF